VGFQKIAGFMFKRLVVRTHSTHKAQFLEANLTFQQSQQPCAHLPESIKTSLAYIQAPVEDKQSKSSTSDSIQKHKNMHYSY
jgi:hypothetical protein